MDLTTKCQETLWALHCLTCLRHARMYKARPELLLLSFELFGDGLVESTFPLSSWTHLQGVQHILQLTLHSP